MYKWISTAYYDFREYLGTSFSIFTENSLGKSYKHYQSRILKETYFFSFLKTSNPFRKCALIKIFPLKM